MSQTPLLDGAITSPAGDLPGSFARTDTWIFDLDNTLYPADCRLFVQIDQRMGEFIARLLGVSFEQAQHLRKTYYKQFGTTLTGLMKVHRIEPTPFLDYVHVGSPGTELEFAL